MMLRRTLFLLSVCGIAAFIVLAAKLYDIQVVHHDEYEAAAIAQQVRETTVSAARGTIYDRSGLILAMSAGVDTVYISPAEIERGHEDAEAIARGLSEIRRRGDSRGALGDTGRGLRDDTQEGAEY